MQVDRLIRGIVETSPQSMQSVSRELHHEASWCKSVARPGRSPALATVADIADVLGLDVALVDRESGEVVAVVDPPRRDGREDLDK